MNRTYIKDIPANIGKEIIIKGWVDVRRDMGKLHLFGSARHHGPRSGRGVAE